MQYYMALYILDSVHDACEPPLWRSQKHPGSATTSIQEDPVASRMTDRAPAAFPMPSQASCGETEAGGLPQLDLRAYQQEGGLSKGSENASQNTEDWKSETC